MSGEKMMFGTMVAVGAGYACLAYGSLVEDRTIDSQQEQADARVERVQQYNAQLQPQLVEISPGVMGTVTIKDKDETFSFTARDDGKVETCTGEYEVEDDVATVAGSIACTQTTTIAK